MHHGRQGSQKMLLFQNVSDGTCTQSINRHILGHLLLQSGAVRSCQAQQAAELLSLLRLLISRSLLVLRLLHGRRVVLLWGRHLQWKCQGWGNIPARPQARMLMP